MHTSIIGTILDIIANEGFSLCHVKMVRLSRY